ncbi:MAG: sugar ABC transporter substrate-binding protein [bacterium]|nr:sugar ABC transporter substrate-binding protein [bacterium]
MRRKQMIVGLVVMSIIVALSSTMATAQGFDYSKVEKLSGMELIEHFNSLGLKDQAALDFWKNIPVSQANKGIYDRFEKEGFQFYLDKYPTAPAYGDYAFKMGMGTEVEGPMSKQQLKLPFTGYVPLPEGPIGDPDKTYRVGYTIHGFNHPWLLNNADTAIWEAGRHSNVELTVLDPQFDNAKQARQVDTWTAQGFDGIMIWPMVEAPTGPPIQRALDKGIPAVSIDRMAGTEETTNRVTGNFPANGTQQGMYLVHRLLKETGKVEGSILLIRKPLGGTADSMRTGHFLKVISYFPGLQVVGNYHNPSSRPDSFQQVQDALMAHPKLDVIFCTGGEQAMGSAQAVDLAKRWDSREGGRRIIILNNDDSHETLNATKEGKLAMTAPYTPLLGALGMRILLKTIAGEKLPQDITTPDIPLVTQEKEIVLGVESFTVEEWSAYAYGPRL